MIEHYLQAGQFWNQQVIKQWNLSVLFDKEHFNNKLNNQKSFSIEDFVRLLNFETGNFYRNRDLYLIFERMKKEVRSLNEKISLDQLKSILGQ